VSAVGLEARLLRLLLLGHREKRMRRTGLQ
jgi:hypothetical protein